MNQTRINHPDTDEHAPFLLAMHSCTETLGVATIDLRDPNQSIRCETFPLGRRLSNSLINCIEKLLPSQNWVRISRIAVATGPGGFTGTRLTIVMARTIAQQIGCPLDGISSFALMAPRLVFKLEPPQRDKSFWIVQDLPRRGIVAGQYLINSKNNKQAIELTSPHLLKPGLKVKPAVIAKENINADVIKLIEISMESHKSCNKSNWDKVLPLYPTSPVGKI